MVAIKNMDMPKTCKECIFCIRQRCLILNKSSLSSIYHDLKRKDCPIICVSEKINTLKEVLEDEIN